jgi:glycine/D-amino acid oxidase-like deaminating enzyme
LGYAGRPMEGLRESPYWWATGTPPAGPAPPLPDKVDVAVIGGGYTGLSAARRLSKAGASVVVLEKEVIGWGASSRNGGQVLTGLKVGPRSLLRRFGRQRAQELFGASLRAIECLENLIAEEGIECGYERCGHLEAAFKPRHFERFHRDQEMLEREFGHTVRLVGKGEQGSELGSDFYHGLMLDERSGALNPARYVWGLGAAAARAGAALRERTPVLEVRRAGARFRVVTSAGVVDARDVLVATNGYTDGALPAFERRVVPVGSFTIATEPLSPSRVLEILPRRRVAFDSKNFLYYFRVSPDNCLLFGGRAQWTPSTPQSTRRSATILREAMLRVFPSLKGVAVKWAWSGNVCFTRDLLPRAGRLDGVHHALGYGGHGVAMATYLGEKTAGLILGDRDRNPFADLPFETIPLYDGRPWFLPLVGLSYRILDWIQ